MARTRSKGGAGTTAATDRKGAATSASKPSSTSLYALPAESDNPPKLFILPRTASPSARVVTLQHPRYGKPARYLVCPEAGFFEFTQIGPAPNNSSSTKSSPRSWLITSHHNDGSNASTNPPASSATAAQVIQSPALHLATPFDPLFLLLPALYALSDDDGGGSSADSHSADSPPPPARGRQHRRGREHQRMFLSLDDHLDALPDPSRHLAETLADWPAARALVGARLAAVCDAVRAGDEDMYRVSEAKVLGEILAKARRMVGQEEGGGGGGLPRSMEERFVKRELEAPVVGVKVARAAGAAAGEGERADHRSGGSGTPASASGEESAESQESVSSVVTAVSSASSGLSAASTAATSVADEDAAGDAVASSLTASEEVIRLQRLRVAFNFICSSYVAPSIAAQLKEGLARSNDLVNFKPLDEYLEKLAELRQEAAAARSTDFSRKRAADEEEDERAEKRRRKEAEEKAKKASMSRGVKELMKVNTSGMKKLSDFFKKKT